jgi:hypothetical protein
MSTEGAQEMQKGSGQGPVISGQLARIAASLRLAGQPRRLSLRG